VAPTASDPWGGLGHPSASSGQPRRATGETRRRCQTSASTRQLGEAPARSYGAPITRPRAARLHRQEPGSAFVARPDVPALLGRRRVPRVRHRRPQPPGRRLAVRRPHAHHHGPRRAADGTRPIRPRAPAAATTHRSATPRRSPDHGTLGSVGSVDDAYDNALAECFVNTLKTELIADLNNEDSGRLNRPCARCRSFDGRSHVGGASGWAQTKDILRRIEAGGTIFVGLDMHRAQITYDALTPTPGSRMARPASAWAATFATSAASGDSSRPARWHVHQLHLLIDLGCSCRGCARRSPPP
jgi:hypothetical protein